MNNTYWAVNGVSYHECINIYINNNILFNNTRYKACLKRWDADTLMIFHPVTDIKYSTHSLIWKEICKSQYSAVHMLGFTPNCNFHRHISLIPLWEMIEQKLIINDTCHIAWGYCYAIHVGHVDYKWKPSHGIQQLSYLFIQ